MPEIWKSSWGEIEAMLALQEADRQFHYPIRHGTMRVGIYSPHGIDDQTAHDQDEIYIVASGSGWFVHDAERSPFRPGDVVFVRAGMPHRFEDFTDDFSTWVIFWGPLGGEPDSQI